MRRSIPTKASRPIRDRPAACAYAALALTLLVLLSAVPAGASEGGNVFGGGAQASTQAAKPTAASKPAGSSGQTTPGGGASSTAAKPAGTSSQAAKPAGSAAVKLSPAERAKLLQAAKTKLSRQVGGTQKTATTATEETTGSKTSTPMILALVAGVLVLGGIAFVIMRDARSVAPVVEGMATGGTRNPEGRLRKRRAQAKAAKLQRKRHRKR